LAEILFYVLALGAIGCGVGVVAARMPLFSVLSLLGSFFCLAGIYLLAGFQFLAATQLLVYAGAIMVLFLFVIMLLNLGDAQELKRHTGLALSKGRLAVAGMTALALTLIGVLSAGWGEVYAADPATTEHGIDELGSLADVLFSRYMLPFEAASILLLATMIAVIALAKRQRPGSAEENQEALGWPLDKGIEQ
jgi:NADH-quinone oxidoreductase subunit J